MLSAPITDTSSFELLSLILPDLGSEQSVELERSDHLHKLIAFCRANGDSVESIASTLDIPLEGVIKLCKREDFIKLVIAVQTSIDMPVKDRVRAGAMMAMEKRYQLLFCGDKTVEEKVSRDFLDRELGKPTQRTESINLNFNASSDLENIKKDIELSNTRLKQMQEERTKLLSA